MSDTFKDASRKDWTRSNGGHIENKDIQIGCLQRIADATELIAKDREQLIRDLEYWKNEAKRRYDLWQRAERSNASLRGQITKLKKAAPQ